MDLGEMFDLSDERAELILDEINDYVHSLSLPIGDAISLYCNIVMNTAAKFIADFADAHKTHHHKTHIQTFCTNLETAALEYFNKDLKHIVPIFEADPQPANGKVSFFGRNK